jgi:hypothetical protein
MIIKQISIFIENKPGRLAEITSIIAQNNINIRALSLADTTNFGVLRIIVDDPDSVEQVLKKTGMRVSVTSVISVLVDDKAGGLANMLRVFAEKNISIEYMYGFVTPQGKACITMRIGNEEDFKAVEMLKNAGYEGA